MKHLLSNLKKVNTNLPPDDYNALELLVKAQKEGIIVIKKADKGGATTIMNRQDYINGMMEHLDSTVVNENGETVKVYREVDPLMLGVHKDIITRTVKDAYENGYLEKNEFENIPPTEAKEGRAFGQPKAHKGIKEGKNID